MRSLAGQDYLGINAQFLDSSLRWKKLNTACDIIAAGIYNLIFMQGLLLTELGLYDEKVQRLSDFLESLPRSLHQLTGCLGGVRVCDEVGAAGLVGVAILLPLGGVRALQSGSNSSANGGGNSGSSRNYISFPEREVASASGSSAAPPHSTLLLFPSQTNSDSDSDRSHLKQPRYRCRPLISYSRDSADYA